jgi:hypothetical protein
MLPAGERFGSLTIQAGASGVALPVGVTTAGNTYANLPSTFGQDYCRTIGVAFEIHNTTAEVYRQGSVITGMLPDPAADSANFLYIDSTASWEQRALQGSTLPVMPATSSIVQTIPTAQVWPASKGVYAIPRLNATTLPVRALSASSRSIKVDDSTAGFPCYTSPDGGFLTIGANNWPTFNGAEVSGFSPIASFFTGLSAETTLTITFRTIVEYFPNVESTILPLASPSSTYEPKVLEQYSRIITEAPYAVPVGMNSAGDYFRRIMSIVGKVAPMAAPLLGPYAPIATGAGMLASSLAQIGARKQNPPKKQQPNPLISRRAAGKRAMPSRRRVVF